MQLTIHTFLGVMQGPGRAEAVAPEARPPVRRDPSGRVTTRSEMRAREPVLANAIRGIPGAGHAVVLVSNLRVDDHRFVGAGDACA